MVIFHSYVSSPEGKWIIYPKMKKIGPENSEEPQIQQKWGPSQQQNGEFSNKRGDVQPT